jgi:hypothetical protein
MQRCCLRRVLRPRHLFDSRLEVAQPLGSAGVVLPEGSESAIDAGFVGVLGAFEVYRGSVRGHRMANLRVIFAASNAFASAIRSLASLCNSARFTGAAPPCLGSS